MRIKRFISLLLILTVLLPVLGVAAWADEQELVDKVEIIGVSAPEPGATAAVGQITVKPADKCQLVASWLIKDPSIGEYVPFAGAFAEGKTYRLQLEIQPLEGYAFSQDVVFTVDGVQEAFRWAGDVIVYSQDYELAGVVSSVKITMPEPKAGNNVTLSEIELPEDAKYGVRSAQWYIYEYTSGEATKLTSGKFRKGVVYELQMQLEVFDGFMIAEDAPVELNGKTPTNCVVTETSVQIVQEYRLDVKEISKIELTELLEPVVDERTNVESIRVPENADYAVKNAYWSVSNDDSTYVQYDGRFLDKMYYSITIEVRPYAEGFVFAKKLKVTLNGEAVGSAQIESGMLSCTIQCVYGPLSNEEPPEITQQIQDITVKSGEDIQLSIGAQGEELSYQWYLNGQKLTDSDSVQGALTQQLVLKADGETCYLDGAQVYCQVTNEKGGRIKSATAIITVEHVDADESYSATEGGHHLNCICGERFEAGEHVYDNDCDGNCNVCNHQRGVAGHVDSNGDGACDNCGETLVKKGGTGDATNGKNGKNSGSGNGTLWLLIVLAVVIVGCIGTVVTLLVLRRER